MTAVITDIGSATWAEQFISRNGTGELNIGLSMELLPRSDIVSAAVIRTRWQDQISYGTQTGQWYLWDGSVHRPCNNGDVERLVHIWAHTLKVALNLVQDDYEIRAASAPDPATAARIIKSYRDGWKLHRQYRDRLFNDSGQRAVISQLRSSCAVDEAAFDTDGRYLVIENGVIDMEAVVKTHGIALLPHSADRMITKKAPVVWDPAAEAGWWHWYLQRSLPDVEVRRYLQKWAGSSLLGRPNAKGLVNLIGPQDSGKSVFIETMLSVVGDYARMVRSQTFLAKRQGDAGYDLHELRGARLVTASEPGQGKYLDDDAVKTVTGSDAMRTREPYGRYVSWKPQCTIFIASNQPMRLDTADGALLNRIKPVQFPKSFKRSPDAAPEERAELRLSEFLSFERAGVFRWLVDGLVDYLQTGLGDEPEAVRRARDEMAVDLDTALEWVEEMIAEGHLIEEPGLPSYRCMPVRQSWGRYREWCAGVGVERPMPEKKFAAVLSRKYPKTVSAGVRLTGIRWNETAGAQVEL